jgi:nucleoid DNA-binding protein
MPVKKAVKKAVKKTTARRKAVKKTAPVKRIPAVKAQMTKSAVVDEITRKTELSKKQVNSVLDELSVLIERHVKKGSVGKFSLPGLMKIEVKRKPATKARKGINPFTGEPTIFKAKPTRNVVKIRPLKKLKDMVS